MKHVQEKIFREIVDFADNHFTNMLVIDSDGDICAVITGKEQKIFTKYCLLPVTDIETIAYILSQVSVNLQWTNRG